MNTTTAQIIVETPNVASLQPAITAQAPAPSRDWRGQLPLLRAGTATLRQLELSDAPSLFEALTREEVTRFITPPPATIEGFERFIAWTRHEQSEGRYACFGIVPEGEHRVVGIIQVRQLEGTFVTAEWGFALGSDYWGTGLFNAGAIAVINFAFETLGVHRLEARAAVSNGRGNAALHKLGATAEGILRRSFLRHGEYMDQVLWALLASDWWNSPDGAPIHLH